MPLLVLHPRGACTLCGTRLRGFMVGTYRINKNTLVSSDTGTLSWIECPECGPDYAPGNPIRVRPTSRAWDLDEKSHAIVGAARAKKGWT